MELDNLSSGNHPRTMVEVEAKLAAPSRDVLDRIASGREIAGAAVEASPAERLETLYVDTAGRALARARVAVRFRRDSRGTERTVKRQGEERDGVFHRREWNHRLEEPPVFPYAVEGALAAELEGVEVDGPLEPLVETRVHRRTLRLRRDERVLAEIALDEVEFRRPTENVTSEPSFEVEVELVDGDEEDLAAIVESLRRGHPLEPARRSKLERALSWAGLEA